MSEIKENNKTNNEPKNDEKEILWPGGLFESLEDFDKFFMDDNATLIL